MFRRWKTRKPHPDPATELKLQHIMALQASVRRQEALAAEHRAHLASARAEQERAGATTRQLGTDQQYGLIMQWQQQRIADANAALKTVEETVAALQQQIAAAVAGLDLTDLTHLH